MERSNVDVISLVSLLQQTPQFVHKLLGVERRVVGRRRERELRAEAERRRLAHGAQYALFDAKRHVGLDRVEQKVQQAFVLSY